MLLYHRTTHDNIYKIIESGKLLASCKIRKKFPCFEYNFFNAIPNKKKFITETIKDTGLIFDISFLLNHIFYVCTEPDYGNIDISTKYKVDNIDDINTILSNLFKHTQKMENKFFERYLMHEVFTKINVSLKFVKYIKLNINDNKLKELINKKYPHIKVII